MLAAASQSLHVFERWSLSAPPDIQYQKCLMRKLPFPWVRQLSQQTAPDRGRLPSLMQLLRLVLHVLPTPLLALILQLLDGDGSRFWLMKLVLNSRPEDLPLGGVACILGIPQAGHAPPGLRPVLDVDLIDDLVVQVPSDTVEAVGGRDKQTYLGHLHHEIDSDQLPFRLPRHCLHPLDPDVLSQGVLKARALVVNGRDKHLGTDQSL
mmetsp:Transcript_24140/g.67131  ORF Transcript_24140/g.67131 Transcript_24140/m.67131 type:complete len:208 (-) Transcript_24140:3450-4073(-)